MCCMEFSKVWINHIFCLHLVARFLFKLENPPLFLGYGALRYILLPQVLSYAFPFKTPYPNIIDTEFTDI